MRAMFASRLPLAATLLAAITVASPAAAESVPYLKYHLHGFGPSQGSSAMTDLPPSPRGRIPPHTPEFADPRGASPGAKPEHKLASPGTRGWTPPANTKYTRVKLSRAR